MNSEFELFNGKSFSDLMKDIYHNSKKKDRQINQLMSDQGGFSDYIKRR